jgi:hypothetical protein
MSVSPAGWVTRMSVWMRPMADGFVEVGDIQQSAIPSRQAAPGASISADNAASTAAAARLQSEAQQRIDAGRHDTIGARP